MTSIAEPGPTVVQNSSPSHRQTSYSASERPHRTQSTASKSGAVVTPQRLPSSSQSYARSSSQQESLARVARKDHEQSNLAITPTSNRASLDRGHGATPLARTVSIRDRNRSFSRQEGENHVPEASARSPPAIEEKITDTGNQHMPSTNGQTRKRTTIELQTGTWVLGKTIGAGSMGKVKLAKNQGTGEQVAVKIVPRQSTDEHRSQQERERADHSKEVRTAREAAIVTLLSHPYICGMRDVMRTHYHWYMLFEYVNGGQMLDYIISHGRLKEKQARKFGRQIASALDYCHRNSIVHRDLKIENILISKTGDIKIIDFGLSNLFSPRNHLKTFCGSLYFAAPELLQARQYTGPEVDIWSFGIVLYVLVCGKVPFDDQSMPQLHAKIKKGIVEYPPWLSAECKNLISRMLVTDPRLRANLGEIMNHPWLTKGFGAPPENYLPNREPLQLPLDPQVVKKMDGFDFGSAESITSSLTKVIESEDYQHAVRLAVRKSTVQSPETERKGSVFGFYKRRNSTASRDLMSNSSAETIQFGSDPINAFSPLISVYYLVREKIERERLEINPGALSMPKSPGEKPLEVPDLVAPPAAHTNSSTYEMAGEAPTGGRSRARARTHGEEEIAAKVQQMNRDKAGPPATSSDVPPSNEQTAPRRESAAVGLFRRLSTRKSKDPVRERSRPPPSLAVSGPFEPTESPRKSFSVRRTRDRESAPPVSLQNFGDSHVRQTDLLSPPVSLVEGASRKLKALGRSTSVNSGDLRRRFSRRNTSETNRTAYASESEKLNPGPVPKQRPADDVIEDEKADTRPRTAAYRAKSLGHARRESIQARRAQRDYVREGNVPEETDRELEEDRIGDTRSGSSPEGMKPVYLKGLFSVSTTSNKPLPLIRADIIRVLRQLGVDFREIKGGFSCRHTPSLDLHAGAETAPMTPTSKPPANAFHRRKISFGGFIGGDREREDFKEQQKLPRTPKSAQRPPVLDRSSTNSDASDESLQRRKSTAAAPGETSTHVQNDLGETMVLRFEIFVVKVPLLSLHGIQFKKVDGGTWQYKNMAQTILNELRL